jgi:hypothetical protein
VTSGDLRVDPAGVHAAGATLGAAAGAPGLAGVAVIPCAGDIASVGVAADLTVAIAELNSSTMSLDLRAGASSERLHVSAETYAQQERSSVAGLADTTASVGPAVLPNDVPTPVLPDWVPTSGVWPGGVVPASGRQASELIHGGAGPAGLQGAAALLDAAAQNLDQAAATVRAARSETEQSWDSDAAAQASDSLAHLASHYTRNASHARMMARQARVQADNFVRARAQMPAVSVFHDLDRRLTAASAANVQPASFGRYSPVIAKLQKDLAAANQEALNAFGKYVADAKLDVSQLDSADPNGPGGQDTSSRRPGADRPAGAADPVADPALGGASPAGAEVMATVVPTVTGLVAGAVGGLLGAIGGAGQKLGQLGNEVLGGLASGANAALTSAAKPAGVSTDPNSSGGSGFPDPAGLDPGGGGDGAGGTEPASVPDGPLAAPAGASAVPEAAPATFSASPAVTEPPVAGAPAGGAMMPLMGAPLGGRGEGSGGEDDRRLYQERRLRIETPPNTEPVKGRREARWARGEKARDSGEGAGG